MKAPTVIVVLGGGISKEGILPPWVISRLEHAFKLSSQDPDQLLLMSGKGRDGFDIAEADAMAEYMHHKKGVPRSRILTEPLSRDTFENACFCLWLHIVPRKVKNIRLLTNDFHMGRTKLIFQKVVEPHCSIDYEAVSDDGIDTDLLQKRSETEQKLTSFYGDFLEHEASNGSDAFHDFIFNENNGFRKRYIQLGEELEKDMVLY